MAVQKRADAVWNGSLLEGSGRVTGASSAVEVALSWPKRAEEGEQSTSPEELLAAAHAACYAMALSHALAQGGSPPDELRVSATVSFQAGEGVTGSHLEVHGQVPGVDRAAFEQAASAAAETCPISKALAGVEITHSASLE
jgi:osmotically inducible protein OsmC